MKIAPGAWRGCAGPARSAFYGSAFLGQLMPRLSARCGWDEAATQVELFSTKRRGGWGANGAKPYWTSRGRCSSPSGPHSSDSVAVLTKH